VAILAITVEYLHSYPLICHMNSFCVQHSVCVDRFCTYEQRISDKMQNGKFICVCWQLSLILLTSICRVNKAAMGVVHKDILPQITHLIRSPLLQGVYLFPVFALCLYFIIILHGLHVCFR